MCNVTSVCAVRELMWALCFVRCIVRVCMRVPNNEVTALAEHNWLAIALTLFYCFAYSSATALHNFIQTHSIVTSISRIFPFQSNVKIQSRIQFQPYCIFQECRKKLRSEKRDFSCVVLLNLFDTNIFIRNQEIQCQ